MAKHKIKNEEVVELAISHLEEVENLEDLEKKIGIELTPEILSEISKKLISDRMKAIQVRRTYNTRGDLDLSIEAQIKIKYLKELQKHFTEIKGNMPIVTEPKKKLNKSPNLQEKKVRLINEIKAISYWVDKDTIELLEKYESSQIFDEKLSCLRQLEEIYIKATQELEHYKKETFERIKDIVATDANVKRNLATTKKVLYDKLNTEEYSAFQEKLQELSINIRKSHHILGDITRLIDLEHKMIKDITKLEFTNEELIEDKNYLEPRNETEKKLQHVLRKLVAGKYVKEYRDKLKYELPEEITSLLLELQELPDNELEELTFLAEDIVKRTRKEIRKNENEQANLSKTFLRKVENEFIRIRPIIYEFDEDTSVYYDILYKLMQDDRNYQYMKSLLEIEEFQRARKEIKEKTGSSRKKTTTREKEHFVLLVLDEFIRNYKLALLDQKLEYQSPMFYKEILKLFINKNTELLPRELTKYISRLNEFSDYVKSKGYQSTSKVLEDIEEIAYFQPSKSNIEANHDSKLRIDEDSRYELYKYSLEEGIKHNDRYGYKIYKNNEISKTFIIEGVDPFAFTVAYLPDGNEIVAVHILDTTKIINFNDLLKKELEDGIILLPKFSEDKSYPTMSFEFNVTDYKTKVTSPIFTPANIEIGEKITSSDLDNYRDKEELKQFFRWLTLLELKLEKDDNVYQEKNIAKIITAYLTESLSYKFSDGNIPFIYKSNLPDIEELIQHNHNEIVTDLMKVPRKQAHKIYNALDDTYSDYYVSEKTTDSSIEFNPNTELGVYLLNTLHKITRGTYEPIEAQEKVTLMLEKFNNTQEYVPESLNKINDKKIKQLTRQYKKVQKAKNNS